MLKLYKNSKGEKLYPVCSWEANQHKLFNAHDRIMNHIYDLEHAEVMDMAELLQAYGRQYSATMFTAGSHTPLGLIAIS